jgi:hypothetical protein
MPSPSSTVNDSLDEAATAAAVDEDDEAMTMEVHCREEPTQGSVSSPQDAPGSLHGACQHYKCQLDGHATLMIDVYTYQYIIVSLALCRLNYSTCSTQHT